MWKLWNEVKSEDTLTCIEVSNGYGLGIASKCKSSPEWHNKFWEVQPIIQTKGELLNRINRLETTIGNAKKEELIRNKHIKNLEGMNEEQNTYIKSLIEENNTLKERKVLRLRRLLRRIMRIKKSKEEY